MSLRLDPKFVLVADIAKKGEGAKVVTQAPTTGATSRVEAKVDVETGGAKPVSSTSTAPLPSTTAAQAQKIPTQAGGAVNVGKGGGVLGHLLAQKSTSALPDPAAVPWQELRAALAPFFGKNVVVTSYDKDEASSLAQAAKSASLGDTHGVLKDVTAAGIVLQTANQREPAVVQSEYWAVARVRLNEAGDLRALAQDPSYPKHFTD